MKYIDFNDIEIDRVLGYGSEGTVYRSDKTAVKVFRCLTENKLEKIKKLAEKNLENFIFPKDLVIEDNDIIGYTMDNIEGISLHDILESNKYTKKEKKKYLLKTQELIKTAHQDGLILGDLNFENFIIKNEQVYAIDTDNYRIDDLENDIMPDYVYPYYKNKISNKIDINSDIYLFGINTLIYLYGTDNYKNAKLAPRLNNYYKELDSKNKTKKYIGNKIKAL